MAIPNDYVERVYAGVLGKLIGVYLGRPFEGWSYDRIMAELGEINYYVHEQRNVPLVVTDDDITGTFTFLRALPDNGNSAGLTAEQIGKAWLNYLIEKRTILWWGGVGNSTEHTAYHRLKNGIPAPQSGSRELNGKVVSEQIGAQIFIDGWAMVNPGNPERAADFARKAGSVSHDGEAIYGAQVVAAMEAHAFVESDINKLIDTAVEFIPKDSVIYKMINDIREWHSKEPDWRKARESLAERYGYDTYGGVCHMVPNHGLIIFSLLYGDDDFQKSLMIVNTSGWDTDCNSGNVGCLLGIKNGLAGIEKGPDYRGPVADMLYLPTADGGRAITDAVTETYHIVNIGRALEGESAIAPKNGARFHFELNGSVQGFRSEQDIESRGTVTLENIEGHSKTGQRSLALNYKHLATGRVARVSTSTFIPPEHLDMIGYQLLASPTLYSDQTVQAFISAADDNAMPVTCKLYINVYGDEDKIERIYSPECTLEAGAEHDFEWLIADTASKPIAQVGIELSSDSQASGTIYLDYLTWSGIPNTTFTRPDDGGQVWRKAWVNGADQFEPWWPEPFRVIHNDGVGLIMQGTGDWANYCIESSVTINLAKFGGIAACVQGMRRFYALVLSDDGKAKVIKVQDEEITTLAEVNFEWHTFVAYDLALQTNGGHLQGWINGEKLFDVTDTNQPLLSGAIAFVSSEGTMCAEAISIRPTL